MSADPNTSAKKAKSTTSGKLRNELTDAERQKLGAGNIGTLFSSLNTELNEIWESQLKRWLRQLLQSITYRRM